MPFPSNSIPKAPFPTMTALAIQAQNSERSTDLQRTYCLNFFNSMVFTRLLTPHSLAIRQQAAPRGGVSMTVSWSDGTHSHAGSITDVGCGSYIQSAQGGASRTIHAHAFAVTDDALDSRTQDSHFPIVLLLTLAHDHSPNMASSKHAVIGRRS